MHNISLEEYKRRYPNHPTKSAQMDKILKETRYRAELKKCDHPECDNEIPLNRKYCSNSCRSKITYKHSLGEYATSEGNPNYTDGKHSYGKKQKLLAFDRDKGVCQRCNKKLTNVTDKYGVHHLIPRRNFTDYKDADTLENLVTLCNKCHMNVEAELVGHLISLYKDHNRLTEQQLMAYLRSKV